jgi:cytochrome c oxidase subunit 3
MQNNLAMTVALISWAMLFATLFMGYAIYRTSSAVWPPMGTSKVNLTLPMLSTLFIVASSWFCFQTKQMLKLNNLDRAKFNLNITIALGFAFMLMQSLLWSHLKTTGLYVGSGIFSSILFGFTWIHAAHMICGIATLLYLRIVTNSKTNNLLQKAINIEKFWHFLGIVWVVMFLTLFVI